MGVMPCARNGCTNILCDRYNPTYGYICDECFEELIIKGLPVEDFIASKKGEDDPFHKYDYYHNIFPDTTRGD
jgi:hypothetical protein